MKKRLLVLSLPFIIILVLVFVLTKKPKNVAENIISSTSSPVININVDYQASFDIYTNGTHRIFTDPKYHNKSEDVYITAENPNVINIKKSSLTWNDFFETLPMKLTSDCLTTGTGQVFCNGNGGELKFYINDIEDPNVLDKIINNNDKLLVTFTSS